MTRSFVLSLYKKCRRLALPVVMMGGAFLFTLFFLLRDIIVDFFDDMWYIYNNKISISHKGGREYGKERT